jgi:XTP/dITP diphosphohydrolase
MNKLVFATNNQHKLQEIKEILKGKFEVVSLKEINFFDEIEEPFETLHENALQKARVVHQFCGLDVFSDDTGLEVDVLNGAPGVYSARYAGENCSFQDNVKKLLKALISEENRKAKFRTVIALILNNKEYTFDGVVEGEITKEQSGSEGFGYDPIFKPEGFETTFAEMTSEAKNNISHRGRAVQKLTTFLKTKNLPE